MGSTMLLRWVEHCVECAPPDCYRTCTLYVARDDRRCARFVDGIVAEPSVRGLFDHGARIRFRRWGKLEARLPAPTVGTDAHRALARFDRVVTRTLAGVESALGRLDPRKRLLGVWGIVREQLLDRLARRRQAAHDAFVLECHSLEREPFQLVLELTQGDEVRGRMSFTIAPGHNLHVVPAETLPPPTGERGGILLSPEGDDERELVFTWLDFVSFVPEARDHAPAPAAKVKCVAWDLDGTLWRGTLVEDGPEGCELDPVAAAAVRALDERGILQTIVSKNDHDDAWALVERTGLSEYFLHPQISWNAKSAGLARAAARLDIGLDTFALVDDSAFERAEVSHALPQVRVYDAASIGGLLELPELDVPITAASALRRRSYVENAQRDEAQVAFDGSQLEFLRSCGLRLRIFTPASADERKRCLELVQRSNQLNLSTRRYDANQLDALVADPDVLTAAFECEDRFGRYGIVGFAAVEEGDDGPLLRDLVLSCRVARKRVEQAFVDWLARREHARGATTLYAEIVPTARNGPLREVFAELPFLTVAESATAIRLELPLAQLPEPEGIVEVVDELEATLPA
ncbi:MAG TPA: HAD-IIIC family phosphatase [Gaiellaceae bacterium]|nr:HAD-IIIC family phosphatase [Gaiellaceae bacterium]